MKLYDVWSVSPESHIFVDVSKDDSKPYIWEEYTGTGELSDREVKSMRATSYPSMSSVIEVKLV